MTQADSVAVHWLQGSYERSKLDEAKEHLGLFFGEPVLRDVGMHFYKRRYDIGEGVMLCFDPGEEAEKDTCHCVIPGKALDSLEGEAVWMLMSGLDCLGWRPSRWDAYYDDMSRGVSINRIWRACVVGDVARFRVYRRTEELNYDGGESVLSGYCVSFGRRGSCGSGRFYRIYDKCLESKGEIDAIRYEVEFSDEEAQVAFSRVVGAGSCGEFKRRVGELVGGGIDFPKRSSGERLLRCKRWRFWSVILDRIGSARLRVPRRKTTLAAKREWVEGQTSKSLAMVYDRVVRDGGAGAGAKWLRDLVKLGHSRMGAVDRALVADEEMKGGLSWLDDSSS